MATLTLQHISGNTYYIPSPTNIGVFVNDNRAVLIDSGNDKEAGRQILKLLKAQNWTLDLIINTHSNADHVGGNAFLQQKTMCRIAATSMESAFIHHPVLEPAFLYGGFPLNLLRNKFLMAKPSSVTDIIEPSGPVLDTGLEAISLPGHYIEMIGIKTPDHVLFMADSVFSDQIVSKYHIVYLYDIQAQFETLEKLASIGAAYYLPSHGALATDVEHLVKINRDKIFEIASTIESCCGEPVTIEEILANVCRRYQIELDANQYVLVISTLKSYVSWLLQRNRLTPMFSDGKMLWKCTE